MKRYAIIQSDNIVYSTTKISDEMYNESVFNYRQRGYYLAEAPEEVVTGCSYNPQSATFSARDEYPVLVEKNKKDRETLYNEQAKPIFWDWQKAIVDGNTQLANELRQQWSDKVEEINSILPEPEPLRGE